MSDKVYVVNYGHRYEGSDIKLVTVAWAEGIQAAIYAFKEITSPYWLNEKRLRDHQIAMIGEKITQAASKKKPSGSRRR